MTRDDLLQALQHNNVLAFLRVIREGESSQNEDAYTIRFGGSHFDAPPWEHPREAITIGRLTSTASGAYQFLWRTWSALVAQYGFPDFSPQCQDEGAVALIAGRKALQLVMEGRFDEAVARCALEWASLPGSPYGQPTRTIAQAREVFLAYGGTLAAPTEETQTQEVTPMVPILIPILAELAKGLIPQLGSLFGSGSDVQQRNVAAATVLADTIVKATGAVNLQEAADKIQNDPGARDLARAAVADVWPSVTEAGSGGLDGARKAAANPDQVPIYKDKTVWITFAFMPLIYMVVIAALIKQDWIAEVTSETRAFVIGFVLGSIGASILAYFYGTTVGSQKKDALIAAK